VYPRYLPRGWGYLENAPVAPPNAFFFGKLWTDPAFHGDLQCRWRELRKGPLDLRAIDVRLAEWASQLRRAEARDHVRWPVLGVKVWPNQFVGKTYVEELDYLHEFIGKRLAFMDTELPGTCAK
jgi:hypothetical protein